MLILSQDKTNIVNLENIIGIGTNNNYINIRSVDGYVLNLGEYDTEERAKEVLQEIIERYDVLKKNTTYAQGDSGFTFNEHYYYEMPEK